MKRQPVRSPRKPSRAAARWRKRNGAAQAVILAGGDGVRLAQARRRAALFIPPERTVIVRTAPEEPCNREEVDDAPPSSLVIQPESRGNGTALFYSLLRVARRPPLGPVVVLPSDQWVSDDGAFMSHVESAIGFVQVHTGLVVVLGIVPTRPEPEYDWIGPSQPVFDGRRDLFRVRLFVEKPGRKLATALQKHGFLWNSFVLVGQVSALVLLLASAAPALVNGFVPSWSVLGTPAEAAVVGRIYRDLPEVDLSRNVLTPQPRMLSVMPVADVAWDDLGDPARAVAVRETLSRDARAV